MPASKNHQHQRRTLRFHHALEQRTADSPWRFSHGSLFKSDREWYVANLPELGFQSGVFVCTSYKPLQLDPLFWQILGLKVDLEASLPFRNQVPYAITAPSNTTRIGQGITNEDDLAKITLEWTEAWHQNNQQQLSIANMLMGLDNEASLSDTERALAICLRILQGDLDTALKLSQRTGPEGADPVDTQEFSLVGNNGVRLHFADKAREWISRERRKSLQLVT